MFHLVENRFTMTSKVEVDDRFTRLSKVYGVKRTRSFLLRIKEMNGKFYETETIGG